MVVKLKNGSYAVWANSTWIDLLYATDYINEAQYKELYDDCLEIVRILVAITKTASNKEK